MTPVPALMPNPGGRPDCVKEFEFSGGLVPETVMLLMAVFTVPTIFGVGEADKVGDGDTAGTPAEATTIFNDWATTPAAPAVACTVKG